MSEQRECLACEGAVYEVLDGLCPVCLGSGTVDAKAARADAVADAETLRVHSARLLGGSHAWAAMQHGMMAERKAWVGKVEDSGAFAGEAARAAFRAVPGLRGE